MAKKAKKFGKRIAPDSDKDSVMDIDLSVHGTMRRLRLLRQPEMTKGLRKARRR